MDAAARPLRRPPIRPDFETTFVPPPMPHSLLWPPLPPLQRTSEPPGPPLTPVVAQSGAGSEVMRPEKQPDVRPDVHDAGASSTASVHVIERRILEHPNDIRAAAHSYAKAFTAYADELRRINDRSKQCDEFIDFLNQMAAGLADLADALDRAFATVRPEPILTKEAAEKARQLCLKLLAWREKVGTDAIDVPGIRVGLFLGGALFLQLLGIDNGYAFAGLSGAVVGFPSKPPKE
jgi:hypothetical protein